MEYKRLISVTGQQSLFELISSKNDGAIVRSLDDNTTRFVSNRNHQFSHLESIEIYTYSSNVNLVDVFKAMGNSTLPLPDAKEPKALKSYFGEVFPQMDMDRVYASDMKKMVRWFKILTDAGIAITLGEEEKEVEEEVEVKAKEDVKD
ncbi:MAG: hypothetical protein EAY75_08535 [Bacteroidetes bacterium]|nr:MAG: hypothetical protein EAY75_08535 [Bacteroidota bacterium]